MADGEKLDKNAKIAQFQTQVIDYAIGRIQRDLQDASNVGGVDYRGQVPFVNRGDLSMKPSDLSRIGENSAVPSKGGEITAAALADLFLAYGRNLTCIKLCTFRVRIGRSLPGVGTALAPTTITAWTNQRTAMSASHLMTAAGFASGVASASAPSDPVSKLGPGEISQESAIDDLITKIRNVVGASMTRSTNVTVTACHSACHSSCHGSRGRR